MPIHRNLLWINRLISLFVLLLLPLWLKIGNPPAPFSPTYVLGFVVSGSMIASIGLWFVTACQGLKAFLQDWSALLWLIFLALLTGWTIISQEWAYGHDKYGGLAQTTALQLLLVALFSLVLATGQLKVDWLMRLMLMQLVLHGIIGNLQVLMQSSLGLQGIGEFVLNPTYNGVSILQVGDFRWLRPYGLTPHPNIYGGLMAVTTLAAASWAFKDNRQRWLGLGLFGFGFYCLLLSFSRSAWLGFAGGGFFALSIVILKPSLSIPQKWRKLGSLALIALFVGLGFVAQYRDLLLTRAGVGTEGTELRSISDRLVYNQIAWDAIQHYPMRGVGAGNYPWYAANYIHYKTDYDLRGDNVHNIYLGILADLGLIGFALFALMLVFGCWKAWRAVDLSRVALLAGFLALAVVGLLDHYTWSLLLMQAYWLGLLAVAMSPKSSAEV